MRTPSLIVALLTLNLWFAELGGYGQGKPIPPGIREADKQSNAPIEPPPKTKEKSADPATLTKEANELAQLSAGIPSDISLLGQGQIQKDLSDKLKRIEKLAKHLRSEITQ